MAASTLTEVVGLKALNWSSLESAPPTGDAKLRVRQAVPGEHPDVLIALDAGLRRSLLVAVPSGESGQFAGRLSRGIAVRTVDLVVEKEEQRFVEVVCLDPDGEAALDVIARELVQALKAGASIARVHLVKNVLGKWRRFWADMPTGRLPPSEQLGLFGELWFLSRWLVAGVGREAALDMWRGPLGGRHDFEATGLSVEVKTSSRLDGAHVIHGLEQMDEPVGGHLLLFSLLVREEAGAEFSLVSAVASARALLGQEHELQARLDGLLNAAGYDDRLEAEYGTKKLRIRGEGLYSVVDQFPRIVPSSLVLLPIGVAQVDYQIRLDGAGQYLMASDADSAVQLIRRFVGRD